MEHITIEALELINEIDRDETETYVVPKIFSFWRYFKTKQNSSLHLQSVVGGIEAEGTRGEGEAAASALKDSNCM